MKRTCFLFLLCILIFVSCSLSDDEDIPASKSLVDIRLSVAPSDSAKTLVPSYPSGTAEYFQYKATALFGSASVQGSTAEWTDFTNNGSVGYFATGSWKFDVRIICGNKTSYGVIYSGSTTVNLTDTSKTVAVVLSNTVDSSKSGTVSFKINVPSNSSKGSLKIYVDDVSRTPLNCTSSLSGSVLTFTGSFSNAAGFRNIRFEYWDTSINPLSFISAQMVSVRVVENATIAVTGNLAGSSATTVNLSISYPKLSVSVSGSSSVSLNRNFSYTCTASGGENCHYQWYLNGFVCINSDSNRYTLNIGKQGTYFLTCVVRCSDGGIDIYSSDSMEITAS